MRRSAAEKMEIIRLVEGTDLPVQATLRQLGVPRSTFYGWYQRFLEDGFDGLRDKQPGRRAGWNRIPKSIKDQVLELGIGHPSCVLARVGPKYRCPVFSKVEMSASPSGASRSGLCRGTRWSPTRCSGTQQTGVSPGRGRLRDLRFGALALLLLNEVQGG